jgi:hypothetical protein
LHGRARWSGGWPIKLNDPFIADCATIHFEIEINNGRAAKAPGQVAFGSPVPVVNQIKTSSTRRREILVPDTVTPKTARCLRSESRALLIAAIARGRRWLDELTTEPTATIESIASRAGCSPRKVNMTVSLAFLAPDLVKAAIEGRLPHGMGVTRLCELPAEWSRQRLVLGLPASQPPHTNRVSARVISVS